MANGSIVLGRMNPERHVVIGAVVTMRLHTKEILDATKRIEDAVGKGCGVRSGDVISDQEIILNNLNKISYLLEKSLGSKRD